MKRYSLILAFVFLLTLASTISAQQLELVGRYDPDTGFVKALAVTEDLAFVGNMSTLRIIDITNRSSPALISSFYAENYIGDIEVRGNYAYLSVCWDGLKIIDIANPHNPYQVGIYPMGSYVYDVFAAGNVVYIVNHFGDYEIIDCSDPTQPYRANGLECDDYFSDSKVKGNYAFLTATSQGLRILDVSDGINPLDLGSNPLMWNAAGIDVWDSIAVIAADDFGVRIVDVSDLSNPVQLVRFPTQFGAMRAAIYRTTAFVVEQNVGIDVIDISNPTQPTLVDTYSAPFLPSEIEVFGDYVYFTSFYFFDILRLVPSSVDDNNEMPRIWSLSQNYPNPFNSSTTIQYSLQADTKAELFIVDILGQEIRRFPIEGMQSQVIWDGANSSGQPASSGIYFYGISGRAETARKMILLR